MTDEADDGDEPVGDSPRPESGDDASQTGTAAETDPTASDPVSDPTADGLDSDSTASPDPDRQQTPESAPDGPTGDESADESVGDPTEDESADDLADDLADDAPETESSTSPDSASPGPSEDAAASADTDSPSSPTTATDQESPPAHSPGVPEDVRTYDRFQKIDGSTYERANDFLRDRTYITAREWAIARLCADFRTETGVEMTKIGEHLPQLVPFMTDTYSPQAVNQARAAFEEKVRKSGATFLYGAMSDFFTAEELDDVMYEATEVAKFLLEVEGVDLTVEEELEAEDTISEVMREVRTHSAALRHDEVTCPECGHNIEAEEG